MLCLAVLVFCVTLTLALYHFNAVGVCECSVQAGRKVFVFKPDLHFRFEMGVGGKGQMGVGLERAKVSVHRSETMFNIT